MIHSMMLVRMHYVKARGGRERLSEAAMPLLYPGGPTICCTGFGRFTACQVEILRVGLKKIFLAPGTRKHKHIRSPTRFCSVLSYILLSAFHCLCAHLQSVTNLFPRSWPSIRILGAPLKETINMPPSPSNCTDRCAYLFIYFLD